MAKALYIQDILRDPMLFYNYSKSKKKIAILTFQYDEKESDLLQKHIHKSIDLRDPSAHDRLRKIVLFFSRHPKPGF